MNTSTKRRNRNVRIAVTAILSAVAAILQFIEFPIPVMPPFVKLDFSDLPALIGTFALGPQYGVLIELVKNLLHLPFGTSAGVGELCNFMFGAVFTLTAGLIYKYKKTRAGAVIASVMGALLMAAVSLPLNYWIVYPAYVKIYGMPMEAIIGEYNKILPDTNSLIKALCIFNLPFTFVKGLFDVIICFCIYKPLSPYLKGEVHKKRKEKIDKEA
ncbi:MAG: Gx transporter family protein [Clostridiales bacterium]|nr:Gx transporter family protein [Clostridiales bacterium]